MTASGDLSDKVIAFAGELGYNLTEWQQQTIRAWYSGQMTQRSRRSGVTTLRNVIQAYETDHPTNRPPHRCDSKCICPIHAYAHGIKTHGQHDS